MADHDTHDHTGVPGVPADAADVGFDPTGLDNTAATDMQAAMEDFDAAISAAGGGSGAGTELDYVAFSSPVSITATSEGTANTVVTGTSQAYAAVPIVIEFYCPAVSVQATTSAACFIVLFDGVTVVGMLAGPRTPAAAANRLDGSGKVRLTPSAGTHQYIVKAWTSSGTSSIEAGAGGTGDYVNGFLRVTKV